jgi:hypothetical protein
MQPTSERRELYKNFCRISKEKRILRGNRHRWEDNIKIGMKKRSRMRVVG